MSIKFAGLKKCKDICSIVQRLTDLIKITDLLKRNSWEVLSVQDTLHCGC